ncbi:MAG: toxin glutamine deamidase domain-containing protein, partial [Dermatophilaceae bacterium]
DGTTHHHGNPDLPPHHIVELDHGYAATIPTPPPGHTPPGADPTPDTDTDAHHSDNAPHDTGFADDITWDELRPRQDEHREPTEHDRDKLLAVLPMDQYGQPLPHPDPTLGWVPYINPGHRRPAPGQPGRRHKNCVDCVISALSTWFGHPVPAADQDFADAEYWPLQFAAMQMSGGTEIDLTTTGEFGTDLDHIARALRTIGHGSAASLMIHGSRRSASHVILAVNHHATIHWIDAQSATTWSGPTDVPLELVSKFHSARFESVGYYVLFDPQGRPVPLTSEAHGASVGNGPGEIRLENLARVLPAPNLAALDRVGSANPDIGTAHPGVETPVREANSDAADLMRHLRLSPPLTTPGRHDWSWSGAGIHLAGGALIPLTRWTRSSRWLLLRPENGLIFDPLTGELHTAPDVLRNVATDTDPELPAEQVRAVVTASTCSAVTLEQIPEQVGGRSLGAGQRATLARLGRLPLDTTADGSDNYLHALLGTAFGGTTRIDDTGPVHHPAATGFRANFAQAYRNRSVSDRLATYVPGYFHQHAPSRIRTGRAATEVTRCFPMLTTYVVNVHVVVVTEKGDEEHYGDTVRPARYIARVDDGTYLATIPAPAATDSEDQPPPRDAAHPHEPSPEHDTSSSAPPDAENPGADPGATNPNANPGTSNPDDADDAPAVAEPVAPAVAEPVALGDDDAPGDHATDHSRNGTRGTGFAENLTWEEIRPPEADERRNPTQEERDRLLAAVTGPDGYLLRHPDPTSGWVPHINPGHRPADHPQGEHRNRNCLDCVMSALSTWFGDPVPAADRGNTNAEYLPLELAAMQIAGGVTTALITTGTAQTDLDQVARAVSDTGPGSAALVEFAHGEDRNSHSVLVVNYQGTIHWVDAQRNLVWTHGDDAPAHLREPQVTSVWSYLLFDSQGNPVPPAPLAPDAPDDVPGQIFPETRREDVPAGVPADLAERQAAGPDSAVLMRDLVLGPQPITPGRHDWSWTEGDPDGDDDAGILLADGTLVSPSRWTAANQMLMLLRPESGLILDLLSGELRTDRAELQTLTTADDPEIPADQVVEIVRAGETRSVPPEEIPEQVDGHIFGTAQRDTLAQHGRMPVPTTGGGDNYLHAIFGTALGGTIQQWDTDAVTHPAVTELREVFATAYDRAAQGLARAVLSGLRDANPGRSNEEILDIYQDIPRLIRTGEAPPEVLSLLPALANDIPGLRVVVISESGQTYDFGDRTLRPLCIAHVGDDGYLATIPVL